MAVRLTKRWDPFDREHIDKLTGHLGVYQLGDQAGDIVYIGVADGRSRFGLKGELAARLADRIDEVTCFRVEINMSYRTRHIELLQAFVYDHGRLPANNTDIDMTRLGRIHPGA